MIILNHETQKFRMVERSLTVARVDEVERGRTRDGFVHRGYVYTEEGRRVLTATIPVTHNLKGRSEEEVV